MVNKKTSIVIAVITCFIACASKQKTDNKKESKELVKLEKATEVDFVTGASGMRGKLFSMNVYLFNEEIKFDSLWIDNKRLHLSQIKKALNQYTLEASYVKDMGEEILIEEKHIEAEIPFPVPTNARALMGYFTQGKRVFLAVPVFEKVFPNEEEEKNK